MNDPHRAPATLELARLKDRLRHLDWRRGLAERMIRDKHLWGDRVVVAEAELREILPRRERLVCRIAEIEREMDLQRACLRQFDTAGRVPS